MIGVEGSRRHTNTILCIHMVALIPVPLLFVFCCASVFDCLEHRLGLSLLVFRLFVLGLVTMFLGIVGFCALCGRVCLSRSQTVQEIAEAAGADPALVSGWIRSKGLEPSFIVGSEVLYDTGEFGALTMLLRPASAPTSWNDNLLHSADHPPECGPEVLLRPTEDGERPGAGPPA